MQAQTKTRKPSGYNMFMRQEIKRVKNENPDFSQKDALSLASKNWKELGPEDKQVYLDLANSQKVENVADRETTGEISKPKRTRKPTAYNMYMSEEVRRLKAENPEIDHKVAFKQAAQNWRNSDKFVNSGVKS